MPEGLLLRPAVTLPVEVYTPEREREFDAAQAELAASRPTSSASPAFGRPLSAWSGGSITRAGSWPGVG